MHLEAMTLKALYNRITYDLRLGGVRANTGHIIAIRHLRWLLVNIWERPGSKSNLSI